VRHIYMSLGFKRLKVCIYLPDHTASSHKTVSLTFTVLYLFLLYFTTLQVSRCIQRRMIIMTVKKNWNVEGTGHGIICICLEGRRKPQKLRQTCFGMRVEPRTSQVRSYNHSTATFGRLSYHRGNMGRK